ncbi:MAG: DUF4832 domain-containing protein [Lachnospiraceae bacterium]|nr:DUF4832 domain-containing protein [Lachnospiraceae bacterium]
MRNIWVQLLITLGLISVIGIGATSGKAFLQSLYRLQWEKTTYTESASYLENPDCGWYEIYGYEIGANPNLQKTIQDHMEGCDSSVRLVQIQINLAQYKDCDVSKEGLQEIDEILTAWNGSGRRIILRFLYDWSGHGMESEPDTMEQILTHMHQVAGVVNAHKDAIYTMQGVFVGDVGEMHGSKYLGTKELRTLVETMNREFDPQLFLALRTPEHVRLALHSNGEIASNEAYNGSLNSRLGFFNDGMMGSESDLGTYGDTSLQLDAEFGGKGTRAEELEFQRKRCAYVPNGGEVVLDNSYNDASNAYETLATMHVSYLNHLHHEEVLRKWKQSAYTGEEAAYQGMSAYDYIGTHLGYRYVLRDATESMEDYAKKQAALTLDIENVGFAPAYRKFDFQLIISPKEEPSTSVVLLDWDYRTFAAGEQTQVSVPLDFSGYPKGTYDVYLQVMDPLTGEYIRLGNPMELTDIGYYLGSFTLEQLYGE